MKLRTIILLLFSAVVLIAFYTAAYAAISWLITAAD